MMSQMDLTNVESERAESIVRPLLMEIFSLDVIILSH